MADSSKILLVNPNILKPPVAPIALDMLAQALAAKGFQPELLDLAFVKNDDELKSEIKKISKKNYLLIAVTIRNIDDSTVMSRDFILKKTKEIIDLIKENSDAPIVGGGVGFSIFPEATIRYLDLNFGVRGDGEDSLVELATFLKDEMDTRYIPGVVIKEGDIIISAPAVYKYLSADPPLSREFVDNARYLKEGGMIGWETKRGCPSSCAYCADPKAKGRKVRMRSPKACAEELSGLIRRGINVFHTCDSEFNIPEAHAVDVCREIIYLGIQDKMQWFAYCSPATFSDELAGCMAESGCKGINFGVDSASNDMLRLLGRNHTKDDLFEVARLCKHHGIKIMFDLLLGGFGETKETMTETIEAMKKLEPDAVGISLGIRIYPDTVYAEQYAHMNKNSAHTTIIGEKENNKDLLKPIFYLSDKIGYGLIDIVDKIKSMTGDDERFFFNSEIADEGTQNYNYNNNSILAEKIKAGARGAFWHILSRSK